MFLFVTGCVDEMLTAGPNVLTPSSDDMPGENVDNVFTSTGATTDNVNPTPTVEFTLNSDQPPQVTAVKAIVRNAETVEVTLEQPNGEKITKVLILYHRELFEKIRQNFRKSERCKYGYIRQFSIFFQTPVLSPDGTVEVNFRGETGSKITIKITKKDTSAPSTVSSVEVKACTSGMGIEQLDLLNMYMSVHFKDNFVWVLIIYRNLLAMFFCFSKFK